MRRATGLCVLACCAGAALGELAWPIYNEQGFLVAFKGIFVAGLGVFRHFEQFTFPQKFQGMFVHCCEVARLA
jgi:hypothetical protein